MNYECKCVGKHVPLPITLHSLHVKGKVMELCPTSFVNLQELLAEWGKYQGRPPGAVRKHYSEYIQKIASDLQ